jgi:hypothetical protein
MPKFRKKPIVVEAWPVREILRNAEREWRLLPSSVKDAYEKGDLVFSSSALRILTLEGVHIADPNDWLICGIKGEFYGCKPDIFAATYEAVEE